jgi:hypothetical protein
MLLEPLAARRSLLARLRALWRADALDRALAAGVDPRSTAAIAARAEVLRSRREREAVASGIYDALKDASRRRPAFTVRVPVQRDAVRDSRAELLALAAELRQATDASARGVATAKLLLTDGDGPLYAERGLGALAGAVSRARVWL